MRVIPDQIDFSGPIVIIGFGSIGRGVLPLLYLENVARYVEKGGAVLVSAGDDYASPLSLYRTPLGQVLPAVPSGRVVEEPFKPKLTELGEKHPVTSDLPGAAGDEPSWGHWFRVVEAENGIEAINRAEAETPDLIIMDVQMPQLDGYEATREIRREERQRIDRILGRVEVRDVARFQRANDRCAASGLWRRPP